MEKLSGSATKATSSFRYAIGMFGTSIPINMYKTYAAIYYVVSLGLETKNYALILFIYTFIDAIDNPVYGFLSDRTRSRWGRRRPWLIIGAPLLVLFFVLFFNPPAFSSQSSLFVYVLLTYIMTGTLDSLINSNYGALFPELFSNDVIRAKTNAMRQAFQLVAMIISIALTPIVTQKLGYSTTAILYGILAVAVIWYCAFGCKENPQALESEKPKLWSAVKAVVTNRQVWIFGFANAFYTAAMSLVLQAVPFFVLYTLKLQGSTNTILLGSVLIVSIISVLLWANLVKRFKLMPSWRASLIIMSIGFLPLFFVRSLISTLLACCLIGFGIAGVMATMDLVGARIMDEDTKKYGLRREGIYCSAMGVLNRVSGPFISLAFLLVYHIYGFVSGDVPGNNPGGAARFLLAFFPFASMLLSCLFSFIMRFDQDKAAIDETPSITEE